MDKKIEEEYNFLKEEVYPPSGSMEVLRDVMIERFFLERVPQLFSRIRKLEMGVEKLYDSDNLRRGLSPSYFIDAKEELYKLIEDK